MKRAVRDGEWGKEIAKEWKEKRKIKEEVNKMVHPRSLCEELPTWKCDRFISRGIVIGITFCVSVLLIAPAFFFK